MKKFKVDNNNFIIYKQQEFPESEFTIIYVHGLLSGMNSKKSTFIEQYCINKKINFVSFDNLGHGSSSLKIEECNISIWHDALEKLIRGLNLSNLIIIGSSMGGWLSLIAAQNKDKKIVGTILIAPAPDFTEWIDQKISKDQRDLLERSEVLIVRNKIPITKQLIEDGKKNTIQTKEKIEISHPVIILHGMDDDEVEHDVSLELTDKIEAPYVCTKLVKYTGHGFGRDEDIRVIINSIEEIMALRRSAQLAQLQSI
ncbi:MAG: alpha/beta hydrolase [Rickettsiaceae bacterium]|nr:alpha/beta hydrolase [Rickettsiaceae bacterium]